MAFIDRGIHDIESMKKTCLCKSTLFAERLGESMWSQERVDRVR